MDRRVFLINAAKAGLVAGLLPLAGTMATAQSDKFQDAMKDLLKGAKPLSEMMTLKMPEIAENGNVVSVTLDASAAEAAGKTLKSLTIFATDNPWPFVATFTLSPMSGKALVTTRMRLARSQKVVAIGAVDDGSFLLAETFVKVTIGGCGG